VAIDFSPGSRRALEAARALARQAGATLTVTHVRPSSDMRAAVVEDRGDLLKPGTGSLSRRLGEHYERRMADWVRRGRGEEARLLRGSPDVALAREASRGYELIVLGSHGLGAVPMPLMGSTAQRVLARTRVPVLVVPFSKKSR
jgi:nucleotide-binding universal stress UspA family protein